MRLPKDQHCAKDPRLFPTGETRRDTLRRQLHSADLQVEFVTILINFIDAEGDAQKLSVSGPCDQTLWAPIETLLLEIDAGAISRYTRRPITQDEGFAFEYNGPPLALQDMIQLDEDNDVQQNPDKSTGDGQAAPISHRIGEEE